jgi:hypothetical protein
MYVIYVPLSVSTTHLEIPHCLRTRSVAFAILFFSQRMSRCVQAASRGCGRHQRSTRQVGREGLAPFDVKSMLEVL